MNGGLTNDGGLFPSFTSAAADLLKAGYDLRFRATGRSMLPTIADGEVITVEQIAAGDVGVGDIVLYATQGSVIAHRVQRIERDRGRVVFLRLRGDASEGCDEPVLPSQVLGRVVTVEREGRKIELTGLQAKLARRLRACASRIHRGIRRKFHLLSFMRTA